MGESTPKAEWTKGPWQFVNGDLYDHGDDGFDNGYSVLMAGARLKLPDSDTDRCRDRVGKNLSIHQIRIGEDTFPEDAGYAEAGANARLIAAAPDMAEALKRAERKLSAYAYVGVCAGDKELNDTVLPMVRAALKRAQGES